MLGPRQCQHPSFSMCCPELLFSPLDSCLKCVGKDKIEDQLTPKLLEKISARGVVNIAAGDAHCMARTGRCTLHGTHR